MNGIQSLLPGQGGAPQGPMPGQAQAPGQAPMPGMQPPQGGPQQGIQSLTPALSQMGIEQLQAELMNPGSQIPKFALLSTIDRKIKERQAMQAVQGQAAMQQNAQQPPGSVAEQILAAAQQMQPPVQARHGGVMRGYAGGGVVAFDRGGAAQSLPVTDIAERFRTPLEEYNDAKRMLVAATKSGDPVAIKLYMDRMNALKAQLGPQVQSAAEMATSQAEAPSVVSQLMEGPPPVTPQAAPIPERSDARRPEIPPQGIVAATRAPAARPEVQKPRPAAPAATTTPQPQPAAATPPSDFFVEYLKNQRAQQEERQKQLDALLGRETALSGERKAEIERRETARKGEMTEAEKARDDALRRATGFGARELFEMAASIDPRRGYVMGSLGKGLAGITGRQAKEQEDARKTFLERSKVLRTEENLLRDAELTRQARDIEVQRGNMSAANALEDKYQALLMEIEGKRYQRTKDEQDLAIRQGALKVQERQAAAAERTAGKPAAEIQLMEWMRNPENRKLYDEIQSAKRAEERRLKLRELYDKRPLGSPEMTFEDFMIEFERSAGKFAGAGSAPPAGAVRLKGQP